jgi:hypothetical protein
MLILKIMKSKCVNLLFWLCIMGTYAFGQEYTTTSAGYYNGTGKDGIQHVQFGLKVRMMRSGDLFLIAWNPVDVQIGNEYRYKGKTYSASLIPEIKQIKVKSFTGQITAKNSGGFIIASKEADIHVGGYLDNSGAVGGNNKIFNEGITKQWYDDNILKKSPYSAGIEVSIHSIYIENYEAANEAIERLLKQGADKKRATEVALEAGRAITAEDIGLASSKIDLVEELDPQNSSLKGLKSRLASLKEEKKRKEAEDKKKAGEVKTDDTKLKKEDVDKTGEQKQEVKETKKTKVEEPESESLREAKRKMYEAGLYSNEGERLYKMGEAFWPAALEQYKKAQTIWRTDQVQERINSIAAASELSKSVDRLGKKIDDGVSIIDPLGKTKHLFWFINYGGLKPNFKKIEAVDDHSARDVSFGINGSRLFINYEARLIYQSTPKVTYTTNLPSENVWVSSEKLGLGLSGGLSVPMFKNALCIYGNYGYNIGLDVKTTIPEGYEILEEHSDVTNDYTTWKPSTPLVIGRITGGVYIKIPKTKIGVNLSYVNSWFKTSKSDDNFGKIKRLSDNKIIEYRAPVQDRIKYSYFSAGIAFPID